MPSTTIVERQVENKHYARLQPNSSVYAIQEKYSIQPQSAHSDLTADVDLHPAARYTTRPS